jgi:uncharacterized protein
VNTAAAGAGVRAGRERARGDGRVARIERMDALRGLALMGIVQVNIQSFTWGAGEPLGYLQDGSDSAQTALFFLQAAFLEGKFYPIFAFLFGVGMALQLRKLRRLERRHEPDGPPSAALARRAYRRRLYVLLGMGIAHGLLLFSGDVLAAYAICALGFIAVAPERPRALLALTVASGAVALLSLLLPVAYGDGEGPGTPDALPVSVRIAHAVYVHDGFVTQLGQRLDDEVWQQEGSVLTFWPQVIALYALGMLAGRLGWVRHPQRHARGWRTAAGIGLAVGLPCALAGAALTTLRVRDAPGTDGQWDAVILGASSVLAVAYVAAAIRAFERPWGRPIARWLAYAGRMSLSNYVLQSICMGALLSGWGLGLGGRATRAQLAAMALGIFLAQVVLSRWLLARYRQGPLEAIWRRWTYGVPD